MRDDIEPTRLEIDDRVYLLKRWGYEDAELWAFRFAKIGIGGMVISNGSINGAVLASLDLLEEARFIELRVVCARYTMLVGEREPIPLNPKVHLQGRLGDLIAIIKAHIEQEFTPFLTSVTALLGAPAEAAAEKKASSP